MLVKVRVLKELPQGQQPGDVIEIEDAVAAVFLTQGIDAVEMYEPTPVPPRGRYRRHDLKAEKTADLTAAE